MLFAKPLLKHAKNYSSEEFVKECFHAVAKALCAEKVKTFEKKKLASLAEQ